MKIIAYKCPDTGKIFEYKNDYNSYRKTYLANRKLQENRQRLINGYNKVLEDFRSTPRTWADMEKWICDKTDLFVERSRLINGYTKKIKTFKFTSVGIDVKYSERCSNTHSAPFNGVTNWGCKDDLPRGYPGWIGRIQLSYTGEYDGFFSDLFEDTGLNFGSGSGGDKTYHAGITFFEADWPGLCERKVFDLLSQ